MSNFSYQNNQTVLNHHQPLILHYYSFRGVAQPIRMLLKYLKTDYVEYCVQKIQQNEIEAGFRVGFPMIQDGNVKIHQQISIMNYLCIKHNQQILLGLTPQDSAKINQLLFKYSSQKKKIYSTILENLKLFEDLSNNQSESGQRTFKKIIDQNKFFEVCFKKILKTEAFVFDYLTIIDFLFYEIIFFISGFYGSYLNKNSAYNKLIKYKDQFQQGQFFIQCKGQIDKYSLFYQFPVASLNQMIEKHWKGCPIDIILAKKQH